MTALVTGAAVWLAIAVAIVAWFSLTLAAGPRRLPGVPDVVEAFLRSWLGRCLLLAGWAEAGWHFFCQHP